MTLSSALSIYIPLWFYSNPVESLDSDVSSEFTFHYGSILMALADDVVCSWSLFTFHYGSILILFNRLSASDMDNLHSTMVLF